MITFKKRSKFIFLILACLMAVWINPFSRRAFARHMGVGDMHGGVPIGDVIPQDEEPNPEPNDVPPNNPSDDDEDLDPVYVDIGEFHHTHQDISIPSRDTPIDIARIYRSQREFNGRFGFGWFFNFYVQLKKLSNNNALILDGSNGRKIEFTYNQSDGSYTPPNGIYDTLQKKPDGTHTLTKKHGKKYNFDINGNLISIVDRNQNQISFTYDIQGKLPIIGRSEYFVDLSEGVIAYDYMLTKITDSVGREIDFTYNDKGRLTTITDFAGRTWTYNYDENDNLTSFTTPPTAEYPEGLTTAYTYDDKHNLVSIIDPNGQAYIINHYNDQDKVDWQTYGLDTAYVSYDSSTTTTVTDRKGYVTEWTYNANGNPTSKKVFTQGLRADDPAYYQITNEYNANMEKTRVVYPQGNCVDYTYDDRGNLLKVCRKPTPGTHPDDPNNLITSLTYEPNYNFFKTITDARGNVTTYTYDYEDPNYGTEVSNLMKITYPEVNAPEGPNSPIVSFTYNLYGQLGTVTRPDGMVTKYEYYEDANDPNNYGHLWKIIRDYNDVDGFNITTEFSYDILGNVVEITDPNGNVSQFAYDNLGRLTQIIAPSPFSYVTNFWYDKNENLFQIDRQTSDSNQPWQITGFTYNVLDRLEAITDPLGYITVFDYDENQNRTLMVDAEDNNSAYVYDERDLLWKVIDANGNVTEYAYDENGNLEEIKDAKGNVTTYTYDDFDWLITVTYPDDSNETHTYDKNSNLTTRTNRTGETILYQYDELNRVIQKTPPDEPAITYEYDIAGRLIDVTQDSNTTTYDYDRLGQMTRVTYADGKQVAYEYDALGRRTKLIYPDSSFVTYKYDALSRLTDIIDDTNTVLAHYDYDALSGRVEATFANGSSTSYEYDLASRLIGLDNDGNSWSLTFDYTYDNVGNRLSMTIDSTDIHNYWYDNIYQLTDVQYPDINSVSYNYDALGNRTNVVNGGTTIYVSNNLNQYASIGGVSLTYDDNGNLTYDGATSYTYDSENRLIESNAPDVNVIYGYDPFGRRISKTVDAVTTTYIYDADQVIAEYDANNVLVRKYVYGLGIDEPIAMATADETYYYTFDGLGSVIALADSNGDLVETYPYDVFGQPRTTSGIGNPYLFTSRRHDESGLYYYRARYYNPHIGCFLQPDPAGYAVGLNLYTYCGNNPVNWTDPYGLDKDKAPKEEDDLPWWRKFVALLKAIGETLTTFPDAEYTGTHMAPSGAI